MRTSYQWLFIPLVAACAANAPTWQKAGAGESAVNEDLQKCRVQVRNSPDPSILAAPAVSQSGTPMIDRGQERDAKEDQQIGKCMQDKGYTRAR